MSKSAYISIKVDIYRVLFVLFTVVIFACIAMSKSSGSTRYERYYPIDPSIRPSIGGSIGGTLQSLMTAYYQFHEMAIIDDDVDGTGEYGLLRELAGGEMRNGQQPPDPPFISGTFIAYEENPFAARSGFYYRSFVPEDVDLAEQKYVVLAWPVERGVSAYNTYLLMPGEIYVWVSPDNSFSGTANAPELVDVFFGEPWQSPINTFDWLLADGY